MPTTTVITTIPPTFFDVHYWLYALIVIGCVTAFFLGILNTQSKVVINADSFIITTFIGAFVGSVIALLLNIIPWIISVAIALGLILYMWRGRGG